MGQRVEGAGQDAAQLVVVQRQQADVGQSREAAVVDAADPVVPQHPVLTQTHKPVQSVASGAPRGLSRRDSQHPQAVQASEHASSHGLQEVGGEVQLHHRGGALERAVLDL